ncbi:MAG: insulinase family protein [Halanaerobiales bacterium]|nr:insulinase family protein [Halanaerobiales bacterium]
MTRTINYKNKKIKEGINLHLLQTSKFKTTLIKIYIQERLREETAPMVALTSYLLFRGTNNRPTTLEMMRYLEELYGADFVSDVEKRGEIQSLTLSLEIINKHYLPSGHDLLEEGLAFIMDVLTNPLMKDEKFDEEYFNQEKAILRDDINSLINDKAKYVNERCCQSMCKNEPYGIFKYGSIDNLDKFTNEDLYRYYSDLLKNNPIHIFIIGDFDSANEVVEKVEKAFLTLPARSKSFSPVVMEKERDLHEKIALQKIIEEEDIMQGKLAIGYRTNIKRLSPKYAALQIFNGLFGGLPHSKLFQNVREKSGLAYYIYSALESTKGILLVSSGIESANLDRVLEIVDQQLQAIKNGEITEQELDFTKKAYQRYFKYLSDSNGSFIDSCMLEVTNGMHPSLDKLMEEMDNVTTRDIQEVAKVVQLDTIYFLKGKEEVIDESDI